MMVAVQAISKTALINSLGPFDSVERASCHLLMGMAVPVEAISNARKLDRISNNGPDETPPETAEDVEKAQKGVFTIWSQTSPGVIAADHCQPTTKELI
jgi:hypothetical protein